MHFFFWTFLAVAATMSLIGRKKRAHNPSPFHWTLIIVSKIYRLTATRVGAGARSDCFLYQPELFTGKAARRVSLRGPRPCSRTRPTPCLWEHRTKTPPLAAAHASRGWPCTPLPGCAHVNRNDRDHGMRHTVLVHLVRVFVNPFLHATNNFRHFDF